MARTGKVMMKTAAMERSTDVQKKKKKRKQQQQE